MDLRIDDSRCKECGICVEECPNHRKKEGQAHVDHHDTSCDRCLHCYAVCPEYAIILDGMVPLNENSQLAPDSLHTHFMYRRSYRRFSGRPVSEDDLHLLIDATRYIPSGGNDHRFDITVLTSEDKRRQLLAAIQAYYDRTVKLLKNPALRFVARHIGDEKVKATLNDPYYYKKILGIVQQIKSEDDVVFYHAPAAFFFHTDRIMPTAKEDCVIAAYNVVLLSETLGLGSCFVSLSQQAVTSDKTCKRILSIPESHRVDAVVVIGHPKRFYRRPAWRPPKDARFI